MYLKGEYIMRRPIRIHPIVKKIIAIGILELIPTTIGIVFYFVHHDFHIMEVVYALLGVLLFLFAIARNWNRDSSNFKKNKTIVEDPKSESYKEYKKFQKELWILGIVNCLLSLLVFFIFNK